jgi:hypothetical protein
VLEWPEQWQYRAWNDSGSGTVGSARVEQDSDHIASMYSFILIEPGGSWQWPEKRPRGGQVPAGGLRFRVGPSPAAGPRRHILAGSVLPPVLFRRLRNNIAAQFAGLHNWNWPFSAGSMPMVPIRSCLILHGRSRPKVGAIDAPVYSANVPNAPGSTTRILGFIGGPEGRPPAAAYLDRQPGISGWIPQH